MLVGRIVLVVQLLDERGGVKIERVSWVGLSGSSPIQEL